MAGSGTVSLQQAGGRRGRHASSLQTLPSRSISIDQGAPSSAAATSADPSPRGAVVSARLPRPEGSRAEACTASPSTIVQPGSAKSNQSAASGSPTDNSSARSNAARSLQATTSIQLRSSKRPSRDQIHPGETESIASLAAGWPETSASARSGGTVKRTTSIVALMPARVPAQPPSPSSSRRSRSIFAITSDPRKDSSS